MQDSWMWRREDAWKWRGDPRRGSGIGWPPGNDTTEGTPMTTAMTTGRPDAAAIEAVLIKGDLSTLTESQRLAHYQNVCASLGLNPLTQPFDYIRLNNKLVLYAKRDAAEQLRKLHGVSITDMQTQHFEDVYVVTVKAQDKTGRTDMSTGAVAVANLKGEALANRTVERPRRRRSGG